MIRLTALALLVVGLMGQQQDPAYDADGHLKAEHQIPAGDYCKAMDVTITARETHAHHCDCTYSCHVDHDGNVTESGGEKSQGCKAYCSKDQRRCTCHPEPVCSLDGQANARMDMNGRVVAVKR
jgi:hypothetical protein